MFAFRTAAALVCCGMSLFARAAFAQAASQQPAAPPPGVIHSVKVTGNHVYASEQIIKTLALKAGEAANPQTLGAAQGRLLGTDLFSKVSYEFRFSRSTPPQYDVTFEVVEFDQLYPLQFSELEVPDAVLREYLAKHVPFYNASIPASQSVLDRYAEAAQAFVAQSHPKLKIKGFLDTANPDKPIPVIRPDRPLPRIASVAITGNQEIETGTLLRALNSVAVGQIFSDANVRDILERSLKPLYAAKGHVAISFPKIDSEKTADGEGYIVKVQIAEGPPFTFGSSTFRGGAFSAEDVQPLMKYRKGEPFDLTKAQQLRDALVQRMRREGQLNAKIDLTQQEDDKNRAVNLLYAINPGPVYTFQSLEIQGLDIESEPAVRKLWAPKPGTPFNPGYPDFFLERVRGLGMFDNLGSTHSTYTTNESTHGVTVRLTFGGKEGEVERQKKRGIPPGAPPQ